MCSCKVGFGFVFFLHKNYSYFWMVACGLFLKNHETTQIHPMHTCVSCTETKLISAWCFNNKSFAINSLNDRVKMKIKTKHLRWWMFIVKQLLTDEAAQKVQSALSSGEVLSIDASWPKGLLELCRPAGAPDSAYDGAGCFVLWARGT